MKPTNKRRALIVAGVAGALFAGAVLFMFWQTREEGPWTDGIGPIGPPPTITGEYWMAEWWAERIAVFALVGSLLFAVTFALVWTGVIGPRNRRLRCGSCGYDLKGLTKPRCPECGSPIAPPAPERADWKRDGGFWKDGSDDQPGA
jgi:hypothetical protein